MNTTKMTETPVGNLGDALSAALASGETVRLGVTDAIPADERPENFGKSKKQRKEKAFSPAESVLNWKAWTELETNLFVRFNAGRHPSTTNAHTRKRIFALVQAACSKIGNVAGKLRSDIVELAEYLRMDVLRLVEIDVQALADADGWFHHWSAEADDAEINGFLAANGVAPLRMVGKVATDRALEKYRRFLAPKPAVKKMGTPAGCRFSPLELMGYDPKEIERIEK